MWATKQLCHAAMTVIHLSLLPKRPTLTKIFFSNYLTGGLSSDESCRRLVPDEVWQRLRYYFPSASEFPAAHSACRACQVFDYNSHWLWFTMTLIYLL